MKARTGCWTCKARKIQCDGVRPICQKCARARRDCQGYGMRLSWPRADDAKRAITGGSRSAVTRPSRDSDVFFFINATWRDIELYRHLSQRIPPPCLVRSCLDPWGRTQVGMQEGHSDLVQYFHKSAHLSLVTFDLKTSRLRDALLAMNMADDTAPGPALFYALLAFSSLCRYGANQQALEFKISALRFLSASTRDRLLTSVEAAQHLATSMLLSSFEILLPSGSSDEWLLHIWGATDIIQASHLEKHSQESATGHLLDWFYYHQALSRFPIHHWRQKHLARHRPSAPSPNPSHAILNLLSEACDTILDPRDPRSHDEEYHGRLRALEAKIGSLIPTPSATEPDPATAALGVEVYQIATQIYLLRASQSAWESCSTGLDDLVSKAFALHVASCSCTHFFPLFIVACEARTDERRAAVLSLIARAQTDVKARNIGWLRHVIQSVWVQQDLHADSDLLLDYLGVISAAISGSSDSPPSFV